jgi:F-type H+-transporting ATPase subunit gamma
VENTKQIRRKIRTVRNIRKITDAMKRVAAAKLRRAQGRVAAGRPYAQKLAEMLSRLGAHAGDTEHPLLEVREPESMALVVIGSNRGLCGSYNGNLLRMAESFLTIAPVPVKLVTVNRKVNDFYRRRTRTVLQSFDGLSDQSGPADVATLSRYLRDLYESGTVDEVHICYTEFVSTMLQRPTILQFLPFTRRSQAGDQEAEPAMDAQAEYILEPDARAILHEVIPAYIDTQIYHVILEAAASEYGSRMMAMSNATDNATEMIRDLTLSYNKARQSGITGELLEIVSGAEALKEAGA